MEIVSLIIGGVLSAIIFFGTRVPRKKNDKSRNEQKIETENKLNE